MQPGTVYAIGLVLALAYAAALVTLVIYLPWVALALALLTGLAAIINDEYRRKKKAPEDRSQGA